MAKRSSLRASDADRERVAERLKQAATEGRILAHELEERLAAALRARTYGDLDAVVADLPGARIAKPVRVVRSRQLAAEHPVAAVMALVAVAIGAVVMAAVLLAGLVALSGVWMILGLIVLAHRGRYGGGPWDRGARGPYRGRPAGSRASRGGWW